MACAAGSAGAFAMKKASSSAIKTAEIFKIILKKKFFGLIDVQNLHENHKKTKKLTVSHVRA